MLRSHVFSVGDVVQVDLHLSDCDVYVTQQLLLRHQSNFSFKADVTSSSAAQNCLVS